MFKLSWCFLVFVGNQLCFFQYSFIGRHLSIELVNKILCTYTLSIRIARIKSAFWKFTLKLCSVQQSSKKFSGVPHISTKMSSTHCNRVPHAPVSCSRAWAMPLHCLLLSREANFIAVTIHSHAVKNRYVNWCAISVRMVCIHQKSIGIDDIADRHLTKSMERMKWARKVFVFLLFVNDIDYCCVMIRTLYILGRNTIIVHIANNSSRNNREIKLE